MTTEPSDDQAEALAGLDALMEQLTRIIEADPDDADAYHHRGVVLGQMAEPLEAIRDFNQVIRLCPDSAEAYYNRGMAHTSLRQP